MPAVFLQAGSKVTCKLLYPRSSIEKPMPMVIKLPPMEAYYYHPTMSETSDSSSIGRNRLLLPRVSGQTAIDGIVGPAFFMQVSVHLSSGSIATDSPYVWWLGEFALPLQQAWSVVFLKALCR